MLDMELKLAVARRDGLMLTVGRFLSDNGFSVVKQQFDQAGGGSLLIVVRGAESGLPGLFEALGNSEHIASFESSRIEAAQPAQPAKPMATTTMASPSKVSSTAPAPMRDADIERQLPLLAHDFPVVLPRLLTMERLMPETQRADTLRAIGRRLGAWIYKRDYALGGRLSAEMMNKRIALPALEQITSAKLVGSNFVLDASPFSLTPDTAPRCHFFCGYLEGVLSQANGGRPFDVQETLCRANGHSSCMFEAKA